MKRLTKRVMSWQPIPLKPTHKLRLMQPALSSKPLLERLPHRYRPQSLLPRNRGQRLQKRNRPRASNACSALLHLCSALAPQRKLWPRAQLKPKVAVMAIHGEVAMPMVIALLLRRATNDEASVLATAEDVVAIATRMPLAIQMRTQMTRPKRANLVMLDAAMGADVGVDEDVGATPPPLAITKQHKLQTLQPAIVVFVGEANVLKARTLHPRLVPIQMHQPK